MNFKEKYCDMFDQVAPEQSLVLEMLEEVRTRKTGKRKAIRFVGGLAAACLCIFVGMPVLAAKVPEIYQLMYLVSPQTAQFFKPVQKADEYGGIRMEVVSAYIHENTAEIYITMQDLTGNRLDDTTDLYDSYSINTPFDCSATCKRVGYDENTGTVTFLITIEQWEEQKIQGEKVTFSVGGFLSHKQKFEELYIPIELSETEDEPEIMETHLTGMGGGSEFLNWERMPDSARVLTPKEPDSRFPLEEFEFTGMGYVDGRLHIQFAIQNALQNDNHGYFFLRDKQGNDLLYNYSLNFIIQREQEGRVDYQDCVFRIPQEELSEYDLYGYFVTSGEFQEGNWTVTIPLE